jgi:anti-sigma B factor antagonist
VQIRQTRATQDIVVVAVSGELDMATSGSLAHALAEAIATPGTAEVLVDTSGVTFCDSSGLNALVQGQRTAADRGICLRVVEPPDRLRMVMEITCVLELLTTGRVIDPPTPRLTGRDER